MNKLIAFLTDNAVFPIALLGGRFPLWGLLYLYIMQIIPLASLICFGIIVIFLRGILAAVCENRHGALSVLQSFYKYIFRPLGVLIFIEIAYLAITYLFLFGRKTDWIIFLAAFACYTVYYALSVLPKKKSAPCDYTIPRDAKFHTVIFLLWLYVFIHPDGLTMLSSAVILIYILELLSVLKVDSERGVLLSRAKL
ncbi:MAG: hypothetical protein LBD73_05270 [Deferribacteraceae bacterium]|nr:hypothetical protein [Deferribacteraceae bacterium]